MRKNTILEIQRPNHASDWQQDGESWERVCDVYGSILPVGGREYPQAQQQHGETTHTIRFSHDPSVNATCRAVDRASDRIFQFKTVINRGDRNKEMEAQAVETSP
jgi:head-tail adaptor